MSGVKIYKIVHHNHDVATISGKPLSHIVLYSPTGFYFNRGGRGQLDLAVSILADYFGENPTKEQLFLWRLSVLPGTRRL